ncbi:MAG: NACHT domain-containing protein [Bacteroidota bacterium]
MLEHQYHDLLRFVLVLLASACASEHELSVNGSEYSGSKRERTYVLEGPQTQRQRVSQDTSDAIDHDEKVPGNSLSPSRKRSRNVSSTASNKKCKNAHDNWGAVTRSATEHSLNNVSVSTIARDQMVGTSGAVCAAFCAVKEGLRQGAEERTAHNKSLRNHIDTGNAEVLDKNDTNTAKVLNKLDGVEELLCKTQSSQDDEKVNSSTESSEKASEHIQNNLRNYYKTHYATIRSLDDKWPIEKSYIQLAIVKREHVMKSECEEKDSKTGQQRQQLLQTYERIHGLKTAITMEQLFDKRDGHDIRTVLLVGRAGIGKTTLCHKIAHMWAHGKWYADRFKAVYVLPVRNLKRSTYNGKSEKTKEDLETAIARECFNVHKLNTQDFKNLKAYITQQLKERSDKVLIILDGLDEHYGASTEIIEQAKHQGKHAHRLWISRPYGVDKEREVVDDNNKYGLLVENIGFNNEQVREYVTTYFQNKKTQLSEQLAKAKSRGRHRKEKALESRLTYLKERDGELLDFLRANPAVHGIAHIPINAQMLCALWAQELTKPQKKARQKAVKSNMTGLYSELIKYIWKRYERKKVGEQFVAMNPDGLTLPSTLFLAACLLLQTGQEAW